jgi:hypothetical protein
MNPKSVVVVHGETPESDRCCAGVSSYPVMIEFVGRRQVRGFPIRCLNQYILQANPDSNGETDTPPDELTLDYPVAVVTLVGWRLDLLAEELRFGHVVRIRVVPPPTTTSKVEEPHVTRIWVRELGDLVSDEAATPVVAQANN